MKKLIIIPLALFFCNFLSAQTNNESQITPQMTFELKNDTLYSNTGLKIFVGQQLVIGNPAGAAGQYRSIVSGKAALVPSIWGQDKRYENAIENYVDSKKRKEKLKKTIVPGKVVTIKGIGYAKTGKPYFYAAGFAVDSDDYKCDIKLALVLKELLLQQ